MLAGCGGKSATEKAKDAAVQAKAACHVFTSLKPATGSSAAAQIDYAKRSARAFANAADLAKAAAADDSSWAKLSSSARAEADSFAIIVRASTEGVTTPAEQQQVYKAVDIARGARPIFIGECAKADPANFTPIPTPSPTSSSSTTPGPSKKA